MDPYIEKIARRERDIAHLNAGWLFDRWRLEVGLVEVVPPSEFDDLDKWEWRRRAERPADEKPCRFLPNFDGTGYLIRDIERKTA